MLNRFKRIVAVFTAICLLMPLWLDAKELWQLRDYQAQKLSSVDPTGANDDGNWKKGLAPGSTMEIGTLQGAGIIKHIWMTIATDEHYHLKKLVLRIYWDNETTPSVETPLGDFFGLGLGTYHTFESRYLSVGSQKALNASFPMPFKKSARFTLTNEGEKRAHAVYYNIDWEKHPSLPDDTAYFHAQYRQEYPTQSVVSEPWQSNGEPLINNAKTDWRENYVILEASGKGHYIGTTHSLIQNQGDWWGEGDDVIYVDGEPTLIGTGAEDYYLGAWCYGGCGINPFGHAKPTFDYLDYGNPVNGGDNRGAQWSLYRFHSQSPIPFNKSIKVTIEHGHANHRSDTYSSVAYWYQLEPHKPFPALPPAKDRLPQMFNVAGPTVGKN